MNEAWFSNLMEQYGRSRPIGYWRSAQVPALPDPAALVDPQWDRAERAAIVEYLQRGMPANAWGGTSYCRLCDPDAVVNDNGSMDFTDGTWRWPEGFSHYVADHDVRPPAEFVTWALDHLDQARTRTRNIVQQVGRGRARPVPTQAMLDELLAQAQAVRVTTTPSELQLWMKATRKAAATGQPLSPVPSMGPHTTYSAMVRRWWNWLRGQRAEQRVQPIRTPIEASQDLHGSVGRGGREDVQALARVLRIRESPNRRPLLDQATVHIHLIGATSASIHIRPSWSLPKCLIDTCEWRWAAFVDDGRGLLQWLGGMGATEPLQELERHEARVAEDDASHAAWCATAPACVRPMLPDRQTSPAPGIYDRAWAALHAAYPTEADAIVALLRWYASNNGRSLGSQDTLIPQLLRQSELRRTLALVENADLDAVALEGVGRLIAYWAAGREPGAARGILPDGLVSRLVERIDRLPPSRRTNDLAVALGVKQPGD